MKVANDCPVNTCWSCPNAESTKSTCVEVRCTPCFDSLMKKHDAKIEKEKSKSFHSGKRKSKRPKMQTDARICVQWRLKQRQQMDMYVATLTQPHLISQIECT